jgi:hypothetical protein
MDALLAIDSAPSARPGSRLRRRLGARHLASRSDILGSTAFHQILRTSHPWGIVAMDSQQDATVSHPPFIQLRFGRPTSEGGRRFPSEAYFTDLNHRLGVRVIGDIAENLGRVRIEAALEGLD